MILTIATLITLAFVACDRDSPTQPVVKAGKATDNDCALCDFLGAFNGQQEEEEDETPVEEAETDSTASQGGPDLIVQELSTSAVVLTPGQTFTLQVTVQNQGDEQAAATVLRYYRSNNSTISASDTEVGTGAVEALDASATSEESIELTASAGEQRYYGACVESVRGESNTDNNCSPAVEITVSEQATSEDEAEVDEETKAEAEVAEFELFREACLEIHQSLGDLILAVSNFPRTGRNRVEGLRGTTRLYTYMLSFNGYSTSGRFDIDGAVNIEDDGGAEDFLLRGQLWLREVDSERLPFIIATRSSIDLDRRKKKVVRIDSKFAEASKEFLVDVKDELVKSITLAYNGSIGLDEPTYIDGFSTGVTLYPSSWRVEDSFIYVEPIENRVAWEFETYSFEQSNVILSGILSDIRTDQARTPIVGELRVYRKNVSEELLELAHPRISGGLRYFDVGIDLLSNSAEGKLRILGRNGTWSDSTRYWTLEELGDQHTPYYYELP